jgi:hypothetical protein
MVAPNRMPASVSLSPRESWLRKSEQRDKWSFCLEAVSMRAAQIEEFHLRCMALQLLHEQDLVNVVAG